MTINLNKPTPKPHVKWGSLIISIVCLAVEIALFALNCYANTGRMANCNLGIGLLAAYGWFIGLFTLGFAATGYFFEGFLPSVLIYNNWKEEMKIHQFVRDARIRDAKQAADDYREFIAEYEL